MRVYLLDTARAHAHALALFLSLSHRQTGTEMVSHVIVRSRRNEISRKVDV